MTEYPPPPPPGNYPPPPPGNYPPPPPPGAGYGPPPGVPPVLPKEAYTPWFTRVLAWLIDWVIVAVPVGIAQGIAIATGENQCTTDTSDGYSAYCTSEPSAVGIIILAVVSLAALAFVIWNYGYRQGTTGSTIGKSVMKFKVVSEKTWQPIGFGLSIVRQIAHVVDGLVCYLGYLWPLWDGKRQTFADKIMTTVCVPSQPGQ
ncbi:transporter [Mycobacterium sp. MS1601]|uniref:RDD family protein n=1 Tax=Mycobacterium sp. MS1601 TaxID=1936029 RepID=UPI00097956E5|nr:RDD family protein [Mycobacterium sp. MS1601]AQA03965.1 transporter [Mycobacterium sp. MS1601]